MKRKIAFISALIMSMTISLSVFAQNNEPSVYIDGEKMSAERIRQDVMNSVCRFEDKEIRVTMSFGCAQLDNKLSIEENIKLADERLYRAKTTGRNKVIAED